jgi:hypothetical protein
LEIQLDASGNILPPSASIQVLVDDLTASLNAVSQDAPDEEVKALADTFATAVTDYHAASMAQESPDAAFDDITTNADKIYATCS